MIMRKQFLCVIGIVFIIAILAACGNNSSTDNSANLTVSDEITETASSEIPNKESIASTEDSKK